MPYVFYDVETTGLRKRFDQIVQFAAVLTDDDLEVQDRFEIRSRLLPHIIPSPGALLTTGSPIDVLLNGSLPSYFELTTQVHERLSTWPAALFVGFNSIAFDEEVLRHALYQNLLPAYVTVSNNRARADALSLARLTAHLRPDVLTRALGDNRRPIFRLAELAAANGIETPRRHVAMGDVETTLALCKLIKEGAPELWSRWARFAQKRAVSEFVCDEAAFVLFEAWTNSPEARVLTRICDHSEFGQVHHCLDLGTDLGALRALSDAGLQQLLASQHSPLVTVRSNKCPLVCPLWEASPEQVGGITEQEALHRAEEVHSDPKLLERLTRAALASEPEWPPSPHVEEQLYGFPFPQGADVALIARFHAADWEDRSALCAHIRDPRLKQLARRIVYFNRPDLLPEATRLAMDAEIHRRSFVSEDQKPPWLTVPTALREIDLLEEDSALPPAARLLLRGLREHLQRRIL